MHEHGDPSSTPDERQVPTVTKPQGTAPERNTGLSSLARASSGGATIKATTEPTRRETCLTWKTRVEESLPPRFAYPRIGIIGSVDFYHKDSPALCDLIGTKLAQTLPHACLLTGANAVVQKQVSRAFHDGVLRQKDISHDPYIFHLAPVGFHCDWDFGTNLEAGMDSEERRSILATLADVYISIEGGPGTSHEMTKAQAAGSIVVPLARTGGASGGSFGASAAVRPDYISEDTWALLEDETASIQDSAEAVVSMVGSILLMKRDDGGAPRVQMRNAARASVEKVLAECLDTTISKRPTLPDSAMAYVEPTLAGCAHLIAQQSEVHSEPPMGNLYLGPQSAAEPGALNALLEAKIGGIVNCTNRVPCHFRDDGIQYCVVAVNDESGADILTYLAGATTFLNSLLSKGCSVLVHCQMGVSRSATVVIAYLIRYWNMTRDEAYIHVKSKRPQTSPNPGFWDQLHKFEAQCHSQRECKKTDTCDEPVIRVEDYFDASWAQLSYASFATCREIPGVLQDDPTMRHLASVKSQKDVECITTVCLDYIWGRGLLDSDLDWLVFICQMLDKRDSEEDSWNESTLSERQAASTVQSILSNEESEFWSAWGGEIYSSQIEKVLRKLQLS